MSDSVVDVLADAAQEIRKSLWVSVDERLPDEITIMGIDNTQLYLVEYQYLGALSTRIAWYGRLLKENNDQIGFHFFGEELQVGSVIRQWLAYSPPRLPSSLDKNYNVVWGIEITPPERGK